MLAISVAALTLLGGGGPTGPDEFSLGRRLDPREQNVYRYEARARVPGEEVRLSVILTEAPARNVSGVPVARWTFRSVELDGVPENDETRAALDYLQHYLDGAVFNAFTPKRVLGVDGNQGSIGLGQSLSGGARATPHPLLAPVAMGGVDVGVYEESKTTLVRWEGGRATFRGRVLVQLAYSRFECATRAAFDESGKPLVYTLTTERVLEAGLLQAVSVRLTWLRSEPIDAP